MLPIYVGDDRTDEDAFKVTYDLSLFHSTKSPLEFSNYLTNHFNWLFTGIKGGKSWLWHFGFICAQGKQSILFSQGPIRGTSVSDIFKRSFRSLPPS